MSLYAALEGEASNASKSESKQDAVITTTTTSSSKPSSNKQNWGSTIKFAPIKRKQQGQSQIALMGSANAVQKPMVVLDFTSHQSESMPNKDSKPSGNEYDPAKPNEFIEWHNESMRRRKESKQKLLEEALRDLKASKQPKNEVRLDMSGEEAYLRRMRMAEPSLITAPMLTASSSKSNSYISLTNLPSATNAIDGDSYADFETNILMFTNMVEPSEVDEELEPEIRMECSRYGSIRSCKIVTLNSHPVSKHRVRIFIDFESIESAIQGIKLNLIVVE